MTTPEPKQLNPNVPLYFVRSWGGADDQPVAEVQVIDGVTVLDTRAHFPDDALVIYGYAIVSPYEEDRAYELDAWKNRHNFLSQCFSIICPDGEMGMTCADEVLEIDKEEFELARAEGWNLSGDSTPSM